MYTVHPLHHPSSHLSPFDNRRVVSTGAQGKGALGVPPPPSPPPRRRRDVRVCACSVHTRDSRKTARNVRVRAALPACLPPTPTPTAPPSPPSSLPTIMLDRDFLVHASAGAIGGACGVYVGAPLDTVKVLLQAQAPGQFKGVWDCLRSTVHKQGPLALYKGALISALGQLPNNLLVFGSFGSSLAWLGRTFPCAPEASKQEHRTRAFAHTFLAGCWAGLLQCLPLAGIEHIKVQQQVGHKHMTMWQCAQGLVAAKGAAGLNRGFWSLVLRDCPTYGLYFVVYEMTKDWLSGGVPDPPAWAMLWAGATAGMAAWAAATPADVVKSMIQGSDIRTPAAHNKILAVARRIYHTEGVRGFFRGLGTSLVRAAPVNAVTFYVYEGLLQMSAYHHPNEEPPKI